jgi:hypothetical protein
MGNLLIGCFTGWQYPVRRRRCLSEWLDHPWLCVAPANSGMDAVFCYGVPQLPRPERHGRDLFLPCPNSYQALPQRTTWLCRWALENPDWDYLFKTDDDVRLDVDRLAGYDCQGADYVGAEWRDGVGYASGNGYWLSRFAAAIVAERLTAMDGPEDLLVGCVLREAGIALRIDNEHFRVFASLTDRPGPENVWVYASPKEREPE